MATSEKSWQSRMSKDQDDLAAAFVESLSVDVRLAKYDIAGSIAHAQMLADCKLITRDEFRQIKQGLTDIAAEIDAGTLVFDKRFEDIHMAVEAELIDRIGEAGKKLHTGRSRNDQVALDMRLWMRDEIATLGEHLAVVQQELVRLAEKQGGVVMPTYTHLQRAQPGLSGHYLLAFVEMLQRDRERLADAAKRVNISPLGSGAVAGSTLELDRRATAATLGFADITRNSIDSTADRDFCIEFVFVCAMIAQHLSRLAEDWIIFSSQEFGFIRIDDAFCTGSSMMPQKRNPDMLELIRGRCGGVYGNLMALLTMMKGLPLTYNRDMQEDKKQVFDAADTIAACLAMAAAIVKNTTFNAERISRGLDEGFTDATALAEYLVGKGVPFRTAHQIVGRLVAQCEQANCVLAKLPLDTLQQACPQIDEHVYEHLTAVNVTARYATEGSAGEKQLKQQLAFWKEQLA
ncbi:MAG: argininosuccinate lyase [Sedimentisphaerales bacterium]|nr:argininosuccinate lyase [Sedimentisphaerales bacterium]